MAGDQLKTASDLGVPVVGIGLLYQQGYFRQAIDRDGAQQALYPYNDPAQLPITPASPCERRVVTARDRLTWLLRLGACVAGPGGSSQALLPG